MQPYELVAEERANVFVRYLALRETSDWSLEAVKIIRNEERRRLQDNWIAMYNDRDVAGVRTRDAIVPNMEAWMSRGWGGISFHVTQLLMGHGCFGTYLHRINKRGNPSCWHCSSECDSPDSISQINFSRPGLIPGRHPGVVSGVGRPACGIGRSDWPRFVLGDNSTADLRG